MFWAREREDGTEYDKRRRRCDRKKEGDVAEEEGDVAEKKGDEARDSAQ